MHLTIYTKYKDLFPKRAKSDGDSVWNIERERKKNFMPNQSDYYFISSDNVGPINSSTWVTVDVQQYFEEYEREWEQKQCEMERMLRESTIAMIQEEEIQEDMRKYPLFYSKEGKQVRLLNIKGKV